MIAHVTHRKQNLLYFTTIVTELEKLNEFISASNSKYLNALFLGILEIVYTDR